MRGAIRYFSDLKLQQAILWCYLIWYATVVSFYFDPTPSIWINALGISAVVGTALFLSVASGDRPPSLWQVFRLYLIPFCVSSFSALSKNQGFIIVVPPQPHQIATALLACGAFLLAVWSLQRRP